jgi:glutamate synthase (NADPH/NADH) large chain
MIRRPSATPAAWAWSRHRRPAAPRGGRTGHQGAEGRLAPGRGGRRRQVRRRRRVLMVEAHRTSSPNQVKHIGHTPRKPGPIAVGQIFLPRTDLGGPGSGPHHRRERGAARRLLHLRLAAGADRSDLGDRREGRRDPARDRADHAGLPAGMDGEALERALYLCRRRIEKKAPASAINELLRLLPVGPVADLQGHVAGRELDGFYPDLLDRGSKRRWRYLPPALFDQHLPRVAAGPAVPDAGPQRRDQHLQGQSNWMRSHEIRMAARPSADHGDDVKPVVQAGGSDSAALDNVFEVLVRAGRRAHGQGAVDSRGLGERRTLMKPEHRALYSLLQRGHGAVGRPGRHLRHRRPLGRGGQGPQRPAPASRRLETHDGLLIAGSEAGMAGLPRAASSVACPSVPGG